MRRILHFFLTPFIALAVIIVQIPEISTEIESWHAKAHLLVIIFLIIAATYNYFITVLSPYRELRASKRKNWAKLDAKAEELLQIFGDASYDFSFNIMIPQRKLYCRYEPSGITFFPKIFMVVWGYGTRGHVHSRLKFTTNQGCCGKAYRDEDFCGCDLKGMVTAGVDIGTIFNLTAEQVRLTQKVIMVASYPIILKENEPDGQKVRIIGVLNVDCRVDQASALITNPAERKILQNIMKSLADFYATV